MKYPVDTKAIREIQGSLWGQIKKTFSYHKGVGQPLPIFAHYGGVFEVGNEKLVMHTDSVGTKVLVAQALEKYDTIGIDAIAMNVNDILCLGAESLVGVDYIALTKEDPILINEIVKGLVIGCEESKCALIGGETAIVPELIRGANKPFDLAFTIVGRIVKDIITGQKIEKGDVLIGLESSGLHSNGFSLARKILDIEKWGQDMLNPTKIYVKSVLDLLKETNIHGIAHITGGAFSKLTRLNEKVGFVLTDMPKLPPIFEEVYREVGDAREMYKTFNCGIGLVLAVKKEDEGLVHQIMKKHNTRSYTIGQITDDNESSGVWLMHENKKIDLTMKTNG